MQALPACAHSPRARCRPSTPSRSAGWSRSTRPTAVLAKAAAEQPDRGPALPHRWDAVSRMFETVLVANRGEIAVRVIRTLREMGIRSVAVHSDADAGALHTRLADVAVPIGPAPAAQSYLSIERVLEAARPHRRPGRSTPATASCRRTSTSPAPARRPGIVFIGPPVAAIEAMGDKIRAKQTVMAAGVPVVPGPDRAGHDRRRRWPTPPSPSASRCCSSPAPAAAARACASCVGRTSWPTRSPAPAARRGAPSATTPCWSSGTSGNSRHIEVQVLGDAHGNVDPPRRARVQPAAPAPEGDRGGAVAAARHRVAGVDGPRGGRRGQGRRLHRRRHRRVHRRRRPAAATSSSWR